MATEHAGHEPRRGRQPLPMEDRGETISCYLPRAISQLGEHADGVHLSRNKLLRQIVLQYLEDPRRGGSADGAGTPQARGVR